MPGSDKVRSTVAATTAVQTVRVVYKSNQPGAADIFLADVARDRLESWSDLTVQQLTGVARSPSSMVPKVIVRSGNPNAIRHVLTNINKFGDGPSLFVSTKHLNTEEITMTWDACYALQMKASVQDPIRRKLERSIGDRDTKITASILSIVAKVFSAHKDNRILGNAYRKAVEKVAYGELRGLYSSGEATALNNIYTDVLRNDVEASRRDLQGSEKRHQAFLERKAAREATKARGAKKAKGNARK